MQTNLSLPIMFRGRTKRQKLDRDMYVHATKNLSVDIPDVSEHETYQASLMINRQQPSIGYDIPALKVFDGNLYRPLSSLENNLSSFRFGDYHELPIGHSLYNHIFWKRELLALTLSRNVRVWPGISLGSNSKSKKLDFVDSFSLLKSHNSDDILVFEQMHDAIIDKLLYIDGNPWIKTQPPCITVFDHWFCFSSNGSGDYKRTAGIKVGYYPEHQDLDFGVVRFPITRPQDALQYASEIGETLTVNYPDTVDLDIENKLLMPDFFELDEDQLNEDEVFRFSFVLASNLVRRMIQHRVTNLGTQTPSLINKQDLIIYEKIKNEVLKCNAVLGTKGGIVDLIPDILRLWRQTRRISYDGLEGVSGANLSKNFERTHKRVDGILDDMPIGLFPEMNLKI